MAFPSNTIHSAELLDAAEVGDQFRVDVHLPQGEGPFPVLVYLDAHLPSGRKVPKWVTELQGEGLLPPLITVGIGQVGSYFRKRNRDFIPQPLHKREKQSYGRAAYFYRFLTRELLPHLSATLPVNGEWTLAGHSLGGLFVLYSLLQDDNPFQNAISLSPSVWINRRNVLKLAEQKRVAGSGMKGKLYMACGALERFNFILPGMRAYADWIRKEENAGMDLRVEELAWKTHFSVVRPGMKKGLEWVFGSSPT